MASCRLRTVSGSRYRGCEPFNQITRCHHMTLQYTVKMTSNNTSDKIHNGTRGTDIEVMSTGPRLGDYPLHERKMQPCWHTQLGLVTLVVGPKTKVFDVSGSSCERKLKKENKRVALLWFHKTVFHVTQGLQDQLCNGPYFMFLLTSSCLSKNVELVNYSRYWVVLAVWEKFK